tara:strand:- start:92 stop:841 length:750 start_codon:yes stop_codon:yes gene_type:complete
VALVHELEAQGNVLFRNRSWIPALFVLAGVVYIYLEGMQFPVESQWLWIGICSAFIFLGQFIRAYAIGYSDDRTSGRNTSAGQVAESINKTGMYSMVRHPLYLGNYFMWLGTLLFVGSWEFVLLCTLAYWLYYERIMFAEEQFLRKKFGSEAYDEWSKSTPPFWPKFANFEKPKNSFDWKDTIRREYLGFCAGYYVICILAVFATSMELGTFAYSEEIKVLFFANLGFFLVVRLLSKMTNVLSPKRLQV